MKKHRLFTSILLTAACIFFISQQLQGAARFISYKNNDFNYEIMVPASWRLVDLNLKDRHIMYSYPEKSTEIKIKAIRTAEEDVDRIVRNNRWNLSNIDSRLNKILETGKIAIKQNVYGKLLVFEYHERKKTMLQRTLISVNGGIVYIIECKAPVKTFYSNDEIFNTALSSFNVLNPAAGEESSDRSPAKDKPGTDFSEDLSGK
jgi:hypothetical protein